MEKMHDMVYFCNSTGDIFLPDKDGENSTTCAASQLPYQLQLMLNRYWFENGSGMLNYLISNNGIYGLMLTSEYNISDYSNLAAIDLNKEMNRIYNETVIPVAARMEQSLKIFCPEAIVYIGYQTGYRNCHEVCVFFPCTTSIEHMKLGLFVLNQISFGEIPPYTRSELDEDSFKKFCANSYHFSGRVGICANTENLVLKTIQFRENGCGDENAIVNIQVALEKDDDDEMVTLSIRDTISNILSAAKKENDCADVDDIITLACNELFPCRWRFVESPDIIIELP